ncbi:hypothetical protein BDM02DRAFT_3260470 [Thelephora ganbajun]|uniref:Uncharacterized protein n=1 Tax=Thelephora ganbajun TaxID=370292 RepID=A0ACB6ZIA5_THEGA|nr:hypothetical protein BDM02DRAFT_3260470 [Thelephora ganbajun]
MATYFLTAISLANLFSPGSTNEVEAAGLSEMATTIPLRKPRDDIPRPEKVKGYMDGVGEGGTERGGRERERIPDSLYPPQDFSGKIEKNAVGAQGKKSWQRAGLMFGPILLF